MEETNENSKGQLKLYLKQSTYSPLTAFKSPVRALSTLLFFLLLLLRCYSPAGGISVLSVCLSARLFGCLSVSLSPSAGLSTVHLKAFKGTI